jgi:tRNA (guanine26-N2/guanine27-N2)-dimethyltransferase
MIKTHEGKAVFYTDAKHKNKISKQLEVFYNPVMKANRDLTILFMKTFYKLNKKKLVVGLPLAGSGIRGIRFLLEAKECIKNIEMNDYDKTAVKNMKKNLKLNKVKAKIFNKDANLFLLENKGYDFIDLDPFGSPNQFLENSIRRLSRGGVLCVTATDTAALTGTYPLTTKWKYWAKSILSPEKHELALRILIRKVQLVGSQYERALTPVFSYAKDHYYRAIFVCKKSKTEAAKIMDNHKMYTPHFFKQEVGPLWVGQLQDKKILREMIKTSELHKDFLKLLLEEEKVGVVGFVDLHEYMKRKKKQGLSHNKVIEKLQLKGYKATRTHFSYKGVKTNSSLKDLS